MRGKIKKRGEKLQITQNRNCWNNTLGQKLSVYCRLIMDFPHISPGTFSVVFCCGVLFYIQATDTQVDLLEYKSVDDQTPQVPKPTAIIICKPESIMCTFIRLYFTDKTWTRTDLCRVTQQICRFDHSVVTQAFVALLIRDFLCQLCKILTVLGLMKTLHTESRCQRHVWQTWVKF